MDKQARLQGGRAYPNSSYSLINFNDFLIRSQLKLMKTFGFRVFNDLMILG